MPIHVFFKVANSRFSKFQGLARDARSQQLRDMVRTGHGPACSALLLACMLQGLRERERETQTNRHTHTDTHTHKDVQHLSK